MFRAFFTSLVLLTLLPQATAQTQQVDVEIMRDAQASWIEKYAAQEIRRYIYVRTGALLEIRLSADQARASRQIVVGTKNSQMVAEEIAGTQLQSTVRQLDPQQYCLQSLERDGRESLIVTGGDKIGTLYAAYRLAEHLGVRFYLHGDVVPDEQEPFTLPDLAEVARPLFKQRGIQPFHDFPEGPDWWNGDDYKAILTQLPKLRMNFFGLHTYPEGGVGPEPTVWIGPPERAGDDGMVTASYPARHFATSNVTSAWGYKPQDTSTYAFGAGTMFDRDDYGADYMQGTFPWTKMDQQKSNALFNHFGLILKDAFTFARRLGVRTCVGTETPLVLPKLVRERLVAAGKVPDDPATVQSVYEGIFRRIMATYPIDYYWLWTPENWTWSEVGQPQIDATLADFRAVTKAAESVEAPFQLATCGWVLGPPQSPALFDSELPKSWPLSCINRNVGHDPVEPGFADVGDRPQWAIPWLEDDPAMIIPQLWVGRMRKDAADALRYGCDGLLGIHWRTRILGPNVAALAQAAWSQEAWNTGEVAQDPPLLEGSFEQRRAAYPSWRKATADDFFLDWAQSQFGRRAGERIGPVFAQLDCALPRPSNWVNGPGGIVPDPRPWSVVRQEYEFVDQLRDLRPLVQGAGNQERFDYWLNNFRYLRAMGKLNCTWAELNSVLESMKQVEKSAERKRLAERKALPLRIRLIRELKYVHEYLLQTVSTKGGMGTVANWQQHVFPLLLDPSAQAIVQATGQPLSGPATLPADYPGPSRMFVPVVRTALPVGEPLRLQATVMGAPGAVVLCFWRPLGAGKFSAIPLQHVARGVYQLELDADLMKSDFEYYIEATQGAVQFRFPATAPALNQTIVLIANTEG